VVEAVTKDQLIPASPDRFAITSPSGICTAYLFGVNKPIAHVMGYFCLRGCASALPRSRRRPIRTMRLRQASRSTICVRTWRPERAHGPRVQLFRDARYGIVLDASLITGIDPPPEVESALAAINTAHNMVSSDISLAQATADQRIEQSKRARRSRPEGAGRGAAAGCAGRPTGGVEAGLARRVAGYVRNVRFQPLGQTQQVW